MWDLSQRQFAFQNLALNNVSAVQSSAKDFSCYQGRGMILTIEVSAFTSGSLTDLILQQKLSDSAQVPPYVTVYDFTALAIGAVGFFPFLIYPTVATAAGWKATINGTVLPQFRVQVTPSNFVGTFSTYFWFLP